ncbi:MAG: methyltransferase domain-containing protein [Candidatus Eiseniibacteriota bacterium]|nr:MAG: methyltransferase domain-containing protein [Candidatus Eisenbacteria bacterium]
MVNYFTDGMDWARYARSRPNIHPTAVRLFRSFVGSDLRFCLALDVGCGTGQSTVALAEVAERVIGIDSSADMLKHATPWPNVEYRETRAEATPFRDGEFNLVAAGQAYHWFEHGAFLAESHRLLREVGWLLVYTSWFTGEIREEPAFRDWFEKEHLGRYPTPPRDRTPLSEELARKHGFELRGQEEFLNELGMTLEHFTDYQLSTTNIIAAVREGTESFDNAERWLRDSLRPFFEGSPEKPFLFNGRTWYAQKPVGG